MTDSAPAPSEMVEKVARAICRKCWPLEVLHGTGTAELSSVVDECWRDHIEQAEFAIAALREMTAPMRLALNTAIYVDFQEPCEAFRLAIDAALKPPTP